MKKVLFLLIGIVITMSISAQRSIIIDQPCQIIGYVFNSDSVGDIVDYVQLSEIDHGVTQIAVVSALTTVYLLVQINFDIMLALHINQKYILYKTGYISRRQFCEYRKEYNKLCKM
jgi:hypothetical protein